MQGASLPCREQAASRCGYPARAPRWVTGVSIGRGRPLNGRANHGPTRHIPDLSSVDSWKILPRPRHDPQPHRAGRAASGRPKREPEAVTQERLKVPEPISGSATTSLTAYHTLRKNADFLPKFAQGINACRSPCQGQSTNPKDNHEPITNKRSTMGPGGRPSSESYSSGAKTGPQLPVPGRQLVEVTEAEGRSCLAQCFGAVSTQVASLLPGPDSFRAEDQETKQ
jgi:hypothetical protein